MESGTYITIQGDTWDSISLAVYGDELHIDLLMQNNFPLLDYCIFPAGIELTIPALPDDEDNDYPDWRTLDE